MKYSCSIWLIAAILRCSAAGAQPMTMEDALGEIPPVVHDCEMREKAAAIVSIEGPQTARQATSEKLCALTAGDAISLAQLDQVTVVDTRTPDEFREVRISNSVNVLAHHIKTKSYMRQRPLLLVGDGRDGPMLEETCADLIDSGFVHVHVLHGGISEWTAQGGEVAGNVAFHTGAPILSPAELYRYAVTDWAVVLLPSTMRGMQSHFSNSVLLRKVDVAVIQRELNRIARPKRTTAILVADTDINEKQINVLAAAIRPIPLLVYAGGSDDYEVFLEESARISAVRAHGPRMPGCGP